MGEVTTIGLDLATHVFEVHGVDAEGATVLRKQLRRAQVLAFQIASASAASCLLRLMYAFTYCAGISRTSCRSARNSRPQ